MVRAARLHPASSAALLTVPALPRSGLLAGRHAKSDKSHGSGSVSVTEAAAATESAAALAEYEQWLQQHGGASAVTFAPGSSRFSNGALRIIMVCGTVFHSLFLLFRLASAV